MKIFEYFNNNKFNLIKIINSTGWQFSSCCCHKKKLFRLVVVDQNYNYKIQI